MQYRMEIQDFLKTDPTPVGKDDKKKKTKKKSSQVVLGKDSKMSTQRDFSSNKLDDILKQIDNNLGFD